jgi:hypothetical protein
MLEESRILLHYMCADGLRYRAAMTGTGIIDLPLGTEDLDDRLSRLVIFLASKGTNGKETDIPRSSAFR